MEKEYFEGRQVVVRAVVGSHNYNLNTPTSDVDYKYFVAPTFDDLYAGKMFSTAKQSDTLDYDCHDIRQLAHLLWKANINFVEVLFSRDIYYHAGLAWVFNHADDLARMNLPFLASATFGMHFQKMKDLYKGTAKTDALVARFGYDTKQACHALRCLYTLERVARGWKMEDVLWFGSRDPQGKALRAVKAGKLTDAQFHNVVATWMKAHKSQVNDYFDRFTPNEALKGELDEKVKDFVRMGL